MACRRMARGLHAFQQMEHLLHHLLEAVSLRLNRADEEELQRVQELQVDLPVDSLLYLEVSWECLEQFLACITAGEGVEQQRKVVHVITKALQQKLKANRKVLLDECLLFVVVLVLLLEHGVELEVARIQPLLLISLTAFRLLIGNIDVWSDLSFVFGQDQVMA